jgi:hypothetical protein
MQATLSRRVCIGPIRSYRFAGVTVYEFRLENTRRLILKVGGPAKFAATFGKDDSQVSQFAGRKPVRNIGDDLARQIEEKFKLEHGELDRPPPRSAIVEEVAAELEKRDPEAQQHVLELVRRIRPLEQPLAASALPPPQPPRRGRKKR